ESRVINAAIQQPQDHDRQQFAVALSNTITKAMHTMHTSSERGRTAVPPRTNATGL
ncbi:hypothetical protein BT96DRAFT_751658, partial [Gymnopus androsaceus JB14]